ncbi:alpha-D-ribose 1-methylphosphonate 5-triphosphate diphosphatase [Rubrimonas cliftonensis]|uniref:alpha-D-ribose 1-methylphosphonate 5-triphosphate diphosphatase n=1 Tax=Rubrimonas cliftonensis TaxID=89524 RepID=UPI000B8140E3|nr:alpha-D-ribose 1-methylphosphonate 5-triphosphate diphosphatase [Rubrimonas cliftonensis]
MEQTTLVIADGRVLTPGGFVAGDLALSGDRVVGVGTGRAPAGASRLDACGRLVLPGVVDIHGDAFEWQIAPRPKSSFPLDVALMESDRQLLANGVTTAFHAVTVSWEPGLRSLESAAAIAARLEALRGRLACDARLHIRWEVFALEAVETVLTWLARRPTPILAFNDHVSNAMLSGHVQAKLPQSAERAGVSEAAYRALLERVWARRGETPDAVARVAAAARSAGAVLLAHDERSPEERARFRALGAATSEFPMNRETAAAARAAGEHTVLGAPNVLRGGSHIGMLDAGPAVAEGLCTVLASDYYYPSPLLAAFRLARDGILPLESAWALVSANAAQAAGLPDRGALAPGMRADVVVVDDDDPEAPRVAAAVVAGRVALRSD